MLATAQNSLGTFLEERFLADSGLINILLATMSAVHMWACWSFGVKSKTFAASSLVRWDLIRQGDVETVEGSLPNFCTSFLAVACLAV